MEGLYKVVEVDHGAGILHLRGTGGKPFRVQLAPQVLADFVAGMKVSLRKSESGGLILEATTPGSLAAGRDGEAAGKDKRRDRRAAPRVEFDGQATVTVGTQTIQCRAQDVSARGMALLLPKHEQLEGPLRLSFRLPSSHRLLRVDGTVARVSRTPSETVWGVGFQKVPSDATYALQAYVAAGAAGVKAGPALSRMDRNLAGLYEDAISGLKDESKAP